MVVAQSILEPHIDIMFHRKSTILTFGLPRSSPSCITAAVQSTVDNTTNSKTHQPSMWQWRLHTMIRTSSPSDHPTLLGSPEAAGPGPSCPRTPTNGSRRTARRKPPARRAPHITQHNQISPQIHHRIIIMSTIFKKKKKKYRATPVIEAKMELLLWQKSITYAEKSRSQTRHIKKYL